MIHDLSKMTELEKEMYHSELFQREQRKKEREAAKQLMKSKKQKASGATRNQRKTKAADTRDIAMNEFAADRAARKVLFLSSYFIVLLIAIITVFYP